ncbi:SDR family NAD(P)-dependent oxidoreductase [Nocardia puris]|uniref:SDR family NAD(P)-dependent oxidoreductase n=1 Tax=Nocardia puris TaxID=208602 RepID=UPI001893C2B4|nr:SDR family NAD(P)-dependent oxidoreductase [Nocardia puris]MBF6212922.1 SDR family NAD(P)-dependent oxidoreductase [Nocardia puris]MBF6367913.1 SDR family NAD(P)-dependent oxidoreductase [Nocardia puris]MBF6463262.1 SDR family NAD(P)-dependent oxidoreductase [Nocardia puris]
MTGLALPGFATTLYADDPVVRDHRVHGVRILPGVVHLDLILRAAAAAGYSPERVTISEALFHRPVGLAPGAAARLEFHVDTASGSVRITSRPVGADGGAAQLVAECTVSVDDSGFSPVPFDGTALVQPRDLEQMYAQSGARGIEHRDFMRARGEFTRDGDHVRARLWLGPEARAHLGAFVLHPTFLDASTIVPFIDPARLGIDDDSAFIPIHFRDVRVHGSTPEEVLVRASVRAAAGGGDLLEADVRLDDPSGAPVVEYRLTSKRVRGAADIHRILGLGAVTGLGDRPRVPSATPSGPAVGGDPRALITADLLAVLAAELAVDPATIATDVGFYELGLDSGRLLRLTAALEARAGEPLYPTLLFEYQTIEALAGYLAEQVGERYRSGAVSTVDPALDDAESQPVSSAGSNTTSGVPDGSADELIAFAYEWRRDQPVSEARKPTRLLVFDTDAAAYPDPAANLVRVRPGTDYAAEPDGYVIDPARPDHLRALLDDLTVRRLSFDAAVYLWGAHALGAIASTGPDLDTAHSIENVYLPLRDLVRAAARDGAPFRLLLAVTLEEPAGWASHALFSGLARTLRLEQPRPTLRSIVCADPAQIPAIVATELEEADSDVEIRYADGYRHVRVPTEISPQEISPAESLPRFDAGAVAVISGGFGGIGRELALRLARTYGAGLVLVSRRPLDAPAAALLADIAAAGGEAVHVRADVSVAADAERVASIARATFGRVDAIFHAAGVLRDGLLVTTDRDDARAVLAPKLSGAVHLTRAIPESPLLVLFSSVSAVLGNPGQADYAAANRFLDAFAETFTGAGRRVVSLGWPVWDGAGMRPPAAQIDALRANGIGLLPVETGVRALLAAIASNRPHLAFAWGDPDSLRHRLFPAVHHPDPGEMANDAPRDQDLASSPHADDDVPQRGYVVSHSGERGRASSLGDRQGNSGTAGVPDDDTSLAIVGFSGRFPGAENAEEFWVNLRDGVDAVGEMPASHPWPAAEPRPVGGFLRDVAGFDPRFFRIPPAHAPLLDPQERLFLREAYAALEHAGYHPGHPHIRDSRVGVFAGVTWSDYRLLGVDSTRAGAPATVASIPSSIANRVSYTLGLRGPSLAVDTACSASLTALHLARRAILAGDCDTALVGGVNLLLHPDKFALLGDLGMLSSGGRCRPFGAGADGYVPGEGVGAVLIKPLSAALADGDTVHAVILGSAVNHGGRTAGYSVPHPGAQAEVIGAALREAGLEAADIDYLEAHGTGTELGDPIEIAGLATVFGRGVGTNRLMGSTKSAIGHLEAAAGIAGLVRILMQLKYERIAPTLYAAQLNPSIDADALPFRLPDRAEPWPSRRTAPDTGRPLPRRAGISAFGAGGANAHVVLSEYLPDRAGLSRTPETVSAPEIFVLSAHSEERLRRYAERMVPYLRDLDQADFGDSLRTLRQGRPALPVRLAMVARTPSEIADELAGFVAGHENAVVTGTASTDAGVYAATAPAEEVARRWVRGAEVDWSALGRPVRRRPLPGYPFEETRYWITALDDRQDLLRRFGDRARRQIAVEAGELELARYAALRLFGTLARIGLGPGAHPLPGLLDTLSIERKFSRLFDRCVRVLVDHGLADRAGDTLVVAGPPPGTEWMRADLLARFPATEPYARLLDTCLDAYPRVLRGELTATEVLFPGGEFELVSAIYRGNPAYDFANDLVADLVTRVVLDRRVDAPLRVLEIGAGTGGTTRAVLDALTAAGTPFEYRYTDVSAGPVAHGRRVFGGDDRIRFDVLDIERDPAAQGFAAGSADLVVCANVLHAARDIATALRHTGFLLAPGGLLACTEAVADREALALTFGLLDGWHACTDPHLRLPDSPLLSESGWRSALSAAGFTDSHAYGPGLTTDPNLGFRLFAALAPEREAAGAREASPATVVGENSGGVVGFASASAVTTVADVDREGLGRGFAGQPESVPGAVAGSLEREIVAVVAAAMDVRVTEIRPDLPFSEYGVDSILAVKIIETLNARYGSALRPTVVFDHPSVRELTGRMFADGARPLGATVIESGARPTVSSSTIVAGPRDGSRVAEPSAESPADRTVARVAADAGLPAGPARVFARHFDAETGPEAPLGRRADTRACVEGSVHREHAYGREPGLESAAESAGGSDGRPGAQADSPTTTDRREHVDANTNAEPAHGVADSRTDIAIIGMSGRFPGAADLEEFWHNLESGVDSVIEVPRSRWSLGEHYRPGAPAPGKTYSRWGGFLDDVDRFDPGFFDIVPAEADHMDPQQRLFLEHSWLALEDAAIDPTSLRRKRCGVFAGSPGSDYATLLRDQVGVGSHHAFTGNSPAILPARVAYHLDLTGPCFGLDTACSSALVAVHQACRSIASGESELALAGGVAVFVTPEYHLLASSMGMLSRQGRCATFDADADGFVIAEGVGAVVLKSLAAARRDGDRIHGVIRGIGVNHDGRTNGITAPSVRSQTELHREVYRRNGIDPSSIGYIEAHGTGTRLGDPIEVEALTAAFAGHTGPAIPIGSVKSNIGHASHAAGMASLFKVLLGLRAGLIPPTLHVQTVNPLLGLDNSPFIVNTALRPWPEGLRTAAISSFGFSGTNAHLVVSAPPADAPTEPGPPGPHTVVLSARSPESLRRAAAALHAHLDRNPEERLGDVAHTLAVGRARFEFRLAVVADSRATLLSRLAAAAVGAEPAGVFVGEVDEARQSGAPELHTDPEAAARQWVTGADVRLAAWSDPRVRRIHLPGYRFDRQRCWAPDAVAPPTAQAAHEGGAPTGRAGIPEQRGAQESPAAPSAVNGQLAETRMRDARAEGVVAPEPHGQTRGYRAARATAEPGSPSGSPGELGTQDFSAAGGAPAEPTTLDAQPNPEQVQPSGAESLRAVAETYLKSLLAAHCRLEPARIRTRIPLSDFGIDSVLISAMTDRMQDHFGPLPSTLFFDYRTVRDLAGYLAEEYPDRVRATRAMSVAPDAAVVALQPDSELEASAGASQAPGVMGNSTGAAAAATVPNAVSPGAGVVDAGSLGAPGIASASLSATTPGRGTVVSAELDAAADTVAGRSNDSAGVVRVYSAQDTDVMGEVSPARTDRVHPDADAIAVIGMAGKFPQAGDIEEFWANLVAGRDCIVEVPPERWDHREFLSEDPDEPGTTYARWGGFLDDVDKFDAKFFGITPRDAEEMDPQQRLFLETSWAALEDAGYPPERLRASARARGLADAGVFAGVGYAEYQAFVGVPISGYFAVANRVSYHLGFTGPSLAVDTACSASLTALHLACESLRRGESAYALAGGVNVSIHPGKYLLLGYGRWASTDGRCRTFGAGGDGYVPGEGVVTLVLKPLRHARADGDRIYGVIRGSAINHGGHTNGFTVPNPAAQATVIGRALDQAGIDPRDIGYVEAHGTGTALGDPIEIAALTRAFGLSGAGGARCGIGSAKSSVGHLEAAAGAAGVVKALLQLRADTMAPNLHGDPPNPAIDFASTPFRVVREPTPWLRPADGSPRITAVSSFGAGGSNAHVVLTDAPEPRESSSVPEESAHIVVLSARDATRLREAIVRLSTRLREHPLPLADVAWTLAVGREAFTHRLAVVAADTAELVRLLEDAAADQAAAGLAVFRGVARTHRDVDELPGESEADRAHVRALLRSGNLPGVAELWASGWTVPWEELSERPFGRIVGLPTYPFARTRHWIVPEDYRRPARPEASRPLSTSIIHSRAVPSAETRAVPVSTTNGHASAPANGVNPAPSSNEVARQSHSTPGSGTAAPDTSDLRVRLREEIREIFADITKSEITDLDVDAEFLDFGFDSVATVRMVNRLMKSHGVKIPAEATDAYPTIRSLADHLVDEGIIVGDTAAAPAPSAASETTAPVEPVETLTLDAPVPVESVFVTGVTGVLGGKLLHDLLATSTVRITCLVRGTSVDTATGRIKHFLSTYDPGGTLDEAFARRVTAVLGDVSEDRFGLDENTWRHLAESTDLTIHAAGRTTLVTFYDALAPINVEGTRRAVDFALGSRGKYLVYVSSFSALGDRLNFNNPPFTERDLELGQGYDHLPYQRTKYESEKLIRAASARGLLWDIVRPGNIMGDSVTGRYPFSEVSVKGAYYDILKTMIETGRTMLTPVHWDITPVDYVTAAMVHIALRRPTYRETYHLTNPDIRRYYDVVQYVRDAGYDVELVALEQFHREATERRIRRRGTEETYDSQTLEMFKYGIELFGTIHYEESSYADSTYTRRVLGAAGITCPPVADLVRVYLAHCAEVGYLPAPVEVAR